MAKKGKTSNWKLLNKRKYDETLQNRDVYETQQLERGTLGNVQTFTFRHVLAIISGVLIFVIAWLFYSLADVSALQKKADEEASRVKPITELAPEQPRELKPVQWLNLTLVERDKYAEFGYFYADYATKSYYTRAEYEIWRDINAKFDARSETVDYYPEIWRRMDGTNFYYVERPYIAEPSLEPRDFSLAEYANMDIRPCHNDEDLPINWRCYHDKGYFYKDYAYERYMTQAEYDKWLEVQLYLDQYIDNGQILRYKDVDVNDPSYDGDRFPYLMPSDVEGLNDETVTQDAGVRATTPLVLDDVVWANMDMVPSVKYAQFRFKYTDRRTGKYYTEPEYVIWSNIQQKVANREEGYIYWREKNDEYGGFNYYLEPPEKAPSEERDVFKAFTDLRLMTLNLVPGERWKAWGYTYADSNTASYCTDAEYARWKDVQDRVERGELGVPDAVANYIIANKLAVTEVIRAAMPVPPEKVTINDALIYIHFMKIIVALVLGGATYLILKEILKRNLVAQNMMEDTSDINQYENDQHIALPEEVQIKFDWFPDAGAHCPVMVSSMISHMMLTNKGINPVKFAKRAKDDIYDADGNLEYYKGEILLDDDGEPITSVVPMFDEDFGDALFETAGNPPEVCKKYSAHKIPYNPGGKNRSKQAGKWDTVAEMINNEWVLPLYETQRPAGAYMVDTEPVNTMVLAMTRAGKGQTVIEPTIDMWTRELRPNNMVINDPKGELLVKNYVRGAVRGFTIVQFNLINAMKTDIYNPLGMAADSAREGDFTKSAMYVDNVATVFFPVDGADDPVWPNAANNAFKRAAYGLMDAFLEDEIEMRRRAEKTGRDQKSLERDIDAMWGRMTLYNCYQEFVNLTSKKKKNPLNIFNAAKEEAYKISSAVAERNKAKGPNEPLEIATSPLPEVQALFDMSDEEYAAYEARVKRLSALWDGAPEVDLLTLYFNATDALPRNSMRVLVSNANNALKSMAGAEKMMASVYGIAITAMSFFVDPTIATLTSGTPSQNVDLAGLSFPRRLGIRFHNDFLKQNHLIGLQVKWSAYNDPGFKENLGKLFTHDDLITREGWAKYYFEGVFPNEKAYIKMEIRNSSTDQLVREMYFMFEKSYQTSLDGRFFVKDPVLSERIVKNGILSELKPRKDAKTGEITYVPGKTTFKRNVIDFSGDNGDLTPKLGETNAIIRFMNRYAEKPKMVFLVTPPHLMNYAKLILILVKQLVDLNFDQSYMTKSTQKPLYKTRFMLDELGNLQSEGHGISGFETMLSIGLGQEQQFTLILQTLQQLKDVYGDSVDRIVQGNTSNIVYLKSTDDSMLDTLQKMSGVTHKTYRDSKTVTRDISKLMMQNEGKASYTITTKEIPVIHFNDMMFITASNSMLFRAGDAPIWNRNETILPMSWRLFKDTITQPGKDYTLQTIPTLSSAVDFDLKGNQPDFEKMLDKRMEQAVYAPIAMELFQKSYGYSDADIARLDIDAYSKEIMEMVNDMIWQDVQKKAKLEAIKNGDTPDITGVVNPDNVDFGNTAGSEDNEIIKEDIARQQAFQAQRDKKIYAGGYISKEMLVRRARTSLKEGSATHNFDRDFIDIFQEIRGAMFADTKYFTDVDGNLYGKKGEVYIRRVSATVDVETLNQAARDEDSRVFAEGEITEDDLAAMAQWEITDAFYLFLEDLESWNFADFRFENEMANRCKDDI